MEILDSRSLWDWIFFFLYRRDFETFEQRNFGPRNITRAVNLSTPFCRKVLPLKRQPSLTVVTVARWSVSEVCNIALRGCIFRVRVFLSFLTRVPFTFYSRTRRTSKRAIIPGIIVTKSSGHSLSLARVLKSGSFERSLRDILRGNLNFNIVPLKRRVFEGCTIVILYAFRIYI